jgi:hypothetical protein
VRYGGVGKERGAASGTNSSFTNSTAPSHPPPPPHTHKGIVAARLGARVVATDLAPNLPLLRANCEANGACFLGGRGSSLVIKHTKLPRK